MFRVVADQLKISEGWVRCGHCADVFDATLYLQPWIPPGAESTPEDFVEAAPEPEFPPEPEFTSQPEWQDNAGADVQVDVPLESEWGVGTADEHALETVPPPVSSEELETGHEPDAEESDFQSELERFAAGLGRLSAARAGAVVSDSTPVEAPDMPEAPAPHEIGEAAGFAASEQDAPEPVPGFVRQARRRAFWQSTGVRLVLSLLVLVLAALLAGQWALHERDRLAAWHPDLQPLLQQACGHLGCTVAPVRRIDAIVIDSTALVRRLGNFYSFDLVLKNTAPLPLAVPALELTLTDVGGAVIARRVFLPDEWPDVPPLLPARESVTVNFRLSLALNEATPMAGYGALLFYP
jgi:predicted Zn finger-like uncharacterized protein